MIVTMEPLRILWICSHRTHRYEEVNLFLKSGAEVVPISNVHSDFPNAIDYHEEDDVLYPVWRETLTMPESIAIKIRQIDYYSKHSCLSSEEKDLINQWFSVVIVGSFTDIVVSFLSWFNGYVVLRAFGGYPYSEILKPETYKGHKKLELISYSSKYYWSPILPYLNADTRVTRNEIIIPPFVSKERLKYSWNGIKSEAYVCDTISLIDRYRSNEYREYLQSFGSLPIKIFGNNEKCVDADNDKHIMGTLSDDEYFKSIASCRVMLYKGLGHKNHLHYHVIEALMMNIPIIFFSTGAISHIAQYYGIDIDILKSIGMCETDLEAVTLANKCLNEPVYAYEMSARQEMLRNIFAETEAFNAANYLVNKLKRKINYFKRYDAGSDHCESTSEEVKRLFRHIMHVN